MANRRENDISTNIWATWSTHIISWLHVSDLVWRTLIKSVLSRIKEVQEVGRNGVEIMHNTGLFNFCQFKNQIRNDYSDEMLIALWRVVINRQSFVSDNSPCQ